MDSKKFNELLSSVKDMNDWQVEMLMGAMKDKLIATYYTRSYIESWKGKKYTEEEWEKILDCIEGKYDSFDYINDHLYKVIEDAIEEAEQEETEGEESE